MSVFIVIYNNSLCTSCVRAIPFEIQREIEKNMWGRPPKIYGEVTTENMQGISQKH